LLLLKLDSTYRISPPTCVHASPVTTPAYSFPWYLSLLYLGAPKYFLRSSTFVTPSILPSVGNASIIGTYIANGFQISNSSGDYLLTPVVGNNDVIISGISSNDIVDAFTLADYRGVEYLVSVDDNTANNRYVSKILITHDNTDPLMVEYGSLTTNSAIGNFAAYSNSTHVTLNFNSLVSNATVRYARVIV
jgi:hypothetical protein